MRKGGRLVVDAMRFLISGCVGAIEVVSGDDCLVIRHAASNTPYFMLQQLVM